LVLINPFGGTKRGPKVWKGQLKQMFDVAPLDVEVRDTERAGALLVDVMYGILVCNNLFAPSRTMLALVCKGKAQVAAYMGLGKTTVRDDNDYPGYERCVL
jgi:hypothetical protein